MIKKRNGINNRKIAGIIAAITLAIFSAITAFVPTTSRRGIAKAEEPTLQTSSDTRAVTDPTVNLFDYRKLAEYGATYNSFTLQSFGYTVGILLSDLCPGIEPGVYTFSTTIIFEGKTVNNNAPIMFLLNDNLKIIITSSSYISGNRYTGTVTLTSADLASEFRFFARANSAFTFYETMINVGDVASPFKSYVTGDYNKGYEDGKVEGIEIGKLEGFSEGYNAAAEQLKRGVLYGATLCLVLDYDEGGTKTVNLPNPYFSDNGALDIGKLCDYYYYSDETNDYMLETADITINFAEPFTYGTSLFGYRGSGSSDVYGGFFIDTNGLQYNCSRDVTSQGSCFFIDSKEDLSTLQIKALCLSFARAIDTMSGGFVIPYTEHYFNGYDNGYDAGTESGYTDGYANGNKDGYRNGYDVGYVEGGQESGNTGFFNLLYAVVDAPVQALTSLFDFEIFGMDMKKFVLSLLTACIVLAVVRLFIGKSS